MKMFRMCTYNGAIHEQLNNQSGINRNFFGGGNNPVHSWARQELRSTLVSGLKPSLRPESNQKLSGSAEPVSRRTPGCNARGRWND